MEEPLLWRRLWRSLFCGGACPVEEPVEEPEEPSCGGACLWGSLPVGEPACGGACLWIGGPFVGCFSAFFGTSKVAIFPGNFAYRGKNHGCPLNFLHNNLRTTCMKRQQCPGYDECRRTVPSFVAVPQQKLQSQPCSTQDLCGEWFFTARYVQLWYVPSVFFRSRSHLRR